MSYFRFTKSIFFLLKMLAIWAICLFSITQTVQVGAQTDSDSAEVKLGDNWPILAEGTFYNFQISQSHSFLEDNILKPGDTINYYISLQSFSNLSAHNLSVLNTLPRDLEITDYSLEAGKGEFNIYSKDWFVGTLQPDEIVRLRFTARLQMETELDQILTISTLVENDPNFSFSKNPSTSNSLMVGNKLDQRTVEPTTTDDKTNLEEEPEIFQAQTNPQAETSLANFSETDTQIIKAQELTQIETKNNPSNLVRTGGFLLDESLTLTAWLIVAAGIYLFAVSKYKLD